MREFLNKKHYTKEENKQFYSDIRNYYDMIEKEKAQNELTKDRKDDKITRALLDSSLIFQTFDINYTHKIVQCGDYYQVYDYHNVFLKKDCNIEKLKDKKILNKQESFKETNFEMKNDGFLDFKKTKEKMIEKRFGRDPPVWLNSVPLEKEKKEEKKIMKKNIERSKSELIKLIKTNEEKFKTFITLTFSENVTDVSEANKVFNIWRTKVKRIKKDFVYIAVLEFQKRGSIHYHLLTNLCIDDNLSIIIPQKNFSEKQLSSMTEEQRSKCYDVKFWNKGYSSVFAVKNINVIGYMSKYMTKDVDDRLFGKKRYLASRSLKKPSIVYLDERKAEDWLRLTMIQTSMSELYSTTYCNSVTCNVTSFTEYKRVEESDLNV